MNRSLLYAAFAAGALTLAAVSCKGNTAGQQAADAPADTLFVSPLSVNGTALVNAEGDTMVLTGPSLGWHSNWGRFYNEGTVRALKEKWGANITRAAIGAHPSGDCVKGYSVDSAYAVNSAIGAIDGAIANDIYVICDWHSHENTLENAKKFFSVITEKYGNDPHIIYEIWNEPLDVEWSEIKEYASEVIPVIRKNAPDAVIIVGTPRWDQGIDLAAADPIEGKNLIYAVHYYAGTHKDWLRDNTQKAIDSGLPVIISECGSMDASGDGGIDRESWQAWIDLADRNRLSVLMWDIADKDESCSMLTPDAPSDGMQWTDANYKEWATLAQETIKARQAKFNPSK